LIKCYSCFTSVNIETFEINVNGRSDLTINAKTKVTVLGDVGVTVSTGLSNFTQRKSDGVVWFHNIKGSGKENRRYFFRKN